MGVYRGKKGGQGRLPGAEYQTDTHINKSNKLFSCPFFYVISPAPYSSLFLHFKISSLSPILSPLSLFLSLSLPMFEMHRHWAISISLLHKYLSVSYQLFFREVQRRFSCNYNYKDITLKRVTLIAPSITYIQPPSLGPHNR